MKKQTEKHWLFYLIVSMLLLLACSKDNNPVTPPTLLAPMPVIPLNNAAGQALPLKMKWTTVENAALYELQISTTNAFSSIVQDDSTIIADSTSVTGLAGGTTYYWRVRAKNSVAISPWTNPWSFTTMLAAPVPASPGNGAINQPITPALTWNTVKGALTYRVQVSTAATFGTLVIDDSTVTDTAKNISTLSYGKTYYWRVRARNNGDTGSWSGTWSFSTMADPSLGAPTLYTPVNGATDQPLDLLLVWTMVSGAAVYELQIAKSDSFANIVCWDSTLTAAFKTIAGLSSGTKYYWRVRAKNASTVSAWSPVFSFSTILLSGPVITINSVGAVVVGGAAGQVTGTIASDSIITNVIMKVLNSSGAEVSSNFTVTFATAYFGRANVDLHTDMNTVIAANLTAAAGTYRLSITAESGSRSSTTTVEFTVAGTAGTPVTTGTVTIGSYDNASVGSSIDLDNGTVMLAYLATASGSGVDLVGTYSSNSAYMTMRIFTPVYARDNSGLTVFSNWPDAAATSIVKAGGISFSTITTVEQIEPLYAAGTPANVWSCYTGDVLVVKTDQSKYVAIEIVAFDATTTGTCTIKYVR